MTQIPDGRNAADAKLVQAKKQLEKHLLQYHQFLEEKVLIENKSQAQLNVESDFFMRLLQSANEVDVLKHPEPEGTFALMALLIRTGFFMRDNYNMMEYRYKLMEQKMAKFEKQIADMSRVGELLKKRLFDMLDECVGQLSKYKELRANGLSEDDVFEAIYNTRKEVITEVLDLLAVK